MSILRKIMVMNSQLISGLNNVIKVKERILGIPEASDQVSKELPKNLVDFYNEVESYELKWEAREFKKGKDPILGLVRILPASSVVKDWDGTVYFSDDDDTVLSNFKIVDFFSSEYCVGFELDGSGAELMEFLSLGETETESMGLDFAGYMEMLLAAKGYAYWQLVILHLRNQSIGLEDAFDYGAEEFKTYMPQLFPDFKWEEFVALYERVRIK